jgi:hypothetical protein
MKPINHFRKYVYAIIIGHRFLNIKYKMNRFVRLHSLKLFINYYESIESTLGQWVFSSIRTPYLSILNFENLKIDITDNINLNNKEEVDQRWLKLETRLDGIMNHLTDNITENKLGTNLIAFLNLIITNNSYIPKEFFTLYEYCRINTVNSELQDLDNPKKQMILCIYILCKILCKNILLDQQYSKGAIRMSNVKKNYKMCASVIYRGVVDSFRNNCPVKRRITEIIKFDDSHKFTNLVGKHFYELNKNPVEPIDPSYSEACKLYGKKESDKREMTAGPIPNPQSPIPNPHYF